MTLATITTYQIYLTVHVLAAVTWVGGAIATQVFAIRYARSRDAARVAAFAKEVEWLGMRVFVPASLLLVIFGFLLVSEGNIDYEFWIVFAIAVWGLSFLTGAAFLGPESGRLAKVFERDGVDSPEATYRLRRIFLVSRIELLFLILVVIDMTLKPGS